MSAVLACPHPRRVFNAGTREKRLEEKSAPSSPGGPGRDDELRELFGDAKEQFLGLRPLSTASTSAGPTPASEDGTCTPAGTCTPSWSSPSRQVRAPIDEDCPMFMSDDAPQDNELGRDTTNFRKVFVGGVPQHMTQDDLTNIFSEIANVKKAWLQKERNKVGMTNSMSQRNHRGFGFVMFQDTSAVDKILGKTMSKFLPIPDGGGKKLEVKRAVNSQQCRNRAVRGHVDQEYGLESFVATPKLTPSPAPRTTACSS